MTGFDRSSESKEITRVGIAVVQRGRQVLVGTRHEDTVLPGMAEFPGGKLTGGESARAAAARECVEETGVRVSVGELIADVVCAYDHGRVRLFFFACQPLSTAEPHAPFRFVDIEELGGLDFPAANADVLDWLSQHEEHREM